MKLSRITKPPRSVRVRFTLAGEVNAALENYAHYEHVHGDPVEPRALISEIVRAFIEADREFHVVTFPHEWPPTPCRFRVFAPSRWEDTAVTAVSQHPQTRSAKRLARMRRGHVTHWPMKCACSIKEGERAGKPAI